VPFTLLLSLTANELTLPTTTDYTSVASTSMTTSLSFDRLKGWPLYFFCRILKDFNLIMFSSKKKQFHADEDAISTYIGGSRAKNKYSLKLALKWLGDTLLPKRQSKHYN
jgi:hypothetical protein